ncbi:MAG: histidinol dehydrogenase [Acidobacteriia bacterium]|nr:histidinol dehydrogenase [Terriglobia bacterium]
MKIWRSGEEKGARYLARLENRMAEIHPSEIEEKARRIVAAVAKRGDKALVAFVRRHDLKGIPIEDFRLRGTVGSGEEVGEDFVNAIELSLANLKAFHEPQMPKGYTLEGDGGDLGIRVRPIESVGVYVPGGSVVYLSSLLMAVVPARIAGVPRIAVATPPQAFLSSPHLRYLLDRLDLHEVYLMGGAHAVAALAYGTTSVTPVDKIVGLGGRWVTAAKRAVFGVVDVDASAGPSEVVVVADAHAEVEIVAADLLAQAEHDPDALAVLLTTSKALAEKVDRRVSARLRALPRKSAARTAIKNWGGIVLVPDLDVAVDLVNRIAPRHVELLVSDPLRLLDGIERAGMVYLGSWAAAALGDYVVGTNHIVPAGGAARFASPLGVWDFVRRTAVVGVTAHRYPALARAAGVLALQENLPLHEESLRAGSRGKA